MTKAAIYAEGLKKSFAVKGRGADGKREVEAVRGVDLCVRKGEIFGFLGPNGAGKTTCQRMLTTLLPIGGGEAAVAGYDVMKQPGQVRKRIGYVGQLGGADLPATGRENLMTAARLYGMPRTAAEKKTGELARTLEIEELLGRFVRTYSGGQRRRLEIALGIIHEPEILFMDEPTTGLDPQNRAKLWEHIRRLKEKGMTVFLTTHYMDEADALADRLAIIDHGRIVAEGTPAELKRRISGEVVALKLKNDADAERIRALGASVALNNEIRRDGARVVLYVADGAKAMPALFDILKSAGIEPESLSLATPTLDDVFLKQTGRALRDAGREGA